MSVYGRIYLYGIIWFISSVVLLLFQNTQTKVLEHWVFYFILYYFLKYQKLSAKGVAPRIFKSLLECSFSMRIKNVLTVDRIYPKNKLYR